MEQSTASTIYENACDTYIREYKEDYTQRLSNFRIPEPTSDLIVLLQNKKYLLSKLEEVSHIHIDECSFNVRLITDGAVRRKEEEVAHDKEFIEDTYRRGVHNLEKMHAQDVLMADHDAKESVKDLYDLKAKLDTYKDLLRDVFIRYNITPDEMEIEVDNKEDMKELLENAIAICEEFNKTTENKIFSKLNFNPETTDEQVGWFFIVAVMLCIIFLAPIFLVYYMYISYKGVKDIYGKIDALKIANALMYYGDFDKFIDRDLFKVDDIDTTELEQEKAEQLADVEDPDVLARELDDCINSNVNTLAERLYDAQQDMVRLQATNLTNITNAIEEIDEVIEKVKSETHDLGTYINPSIVMKYQYIVSRYDDGIPCVCEISDKNLIFSDKDRDTMLNYIKVLFCNILLNVKEKHLYVTFVDPVTLGTSFSEFLATETQDYIKVYTDDPEKELEAIKTELSNRVKKIQTQNIQEFNKECEEVGKVPLDYKLYIFLCDKHVLEESKLFNQLAQYSTQYGIILWALADLKIPNTTCFSEPVYPEGTPITYDFSLGARCWNTYIDAFKNSKGTIIPYFKGFANKHIPRDKWWTYSTKKGIDLHLGLLNGDPDRADVTTLGDDLVHGEMIGTTGAGKSVMLNQMLASLVTMYSPNELSLVMVDFKNVEFSFYADKETHSFSRLPHTKILSGTKDGEYALSVFDYLCKEMDRRQALFTECGVKKLEEYRDKFPDAIMPRILVIIDEFQVMFTEVESRIVNKIQDRIRSLSKLARFCGCHLFFTSQSMEGTMTKDVQDQFTLRVALFCMADVAQKVLGDDAPSKMKSKKGSCYSNENGASTKDRNKFWKIPLIQNDDLDYIMDELNGMWNKTNTTEFYDEKRMYYEKDLIQWYEKHGEAFRDPHVFILGEQTSFSENKAPINIRMIPDDGENALILAKRREDLWNLNLTLINNLKKSDESQILIHCADKDTYEVCGIDLIVDEPLIEMSKPNYDWQSLLDLWREYIDARVDIPKEELTPTYIFCMNYDKQKGYGRNSSPRLTAQFEALMQDGPMVDVHFIVSLRSKGELVSTNYKFFNHKIVGYTDEGNLASQLIDTDKVTKFPTAKGEGVFAIYRQGAEGIKFKVYQNNFARELVDNTIYIA